MGHPIPRTAYNDPKNCVLVVPVVGRQGMTFQESIVRQLVRLGGSCGPYCRSKPPSGGYEREPDRIS